MTEFISRKFGNEGYEIIIKTDSHEHYRATEDFARKLIDHAKPIREKAHGHIVNVKTCFYDKAETFDNCTVQVLTNTVTGDVSVGWWKNDAD